MTRAFQSGQVPDLGFWSLSDFHHHLHQQTGKDPPRPNNNGLDSGFDLVNICLRFKSDPEVECLICPERFDHPSQHQDLLQHLLGDHNIVIGDVKLIANFPAYIRYWRNKFRTNPASNFCTSMTAPVRIGNLVLMH